MSGYLSKIKKRTKKKKVALGKVGLKDMYYFNWVNWGFAFHFEIFFIFTFIVIPYFIVKPKKTTLK